MNTNPTLNRIRLIGFFLLLLAGVNLPAQSKKAKKRVEQGWLALQQEQPQNALGAFVDAIDLDANYADAYLGRGETYFSLGNYPAALSDLNRCIALNPQFMRAYFMRGLAHQRLKQFAAAIPDYTKYLETYPNDITASNNRFSCYLALQRWREAAVDLQLLVQQGVRSDTNCYNFALASFMLGDTNQAIRLLDQALSLNPKMYEALELKGHILLKQERFLQSKEIYDKCIALDSDNKWLYHGRGLAFLGLDQFEQAAADFTEVIASYPDSAIAYYNRGLSWLALTDFSNAASDFKQAAHYRPFSAKIWNELAIAEFYSENTDAAFAASDKALALDSTLYAAWMVRVDLYFLTEDFENALQCINRAMQLQTSANAYSYRGNLYVNLNDPVAAEKDYRKALTMDSSLTIAHLGLIHLYGTQRKFSIVQQQRLTFLKATANSIETRLLCAEAFIQFNLNDTAIVDYTAAIAAEPDNAKYWYSRGLCWYSKGNKANAAADFRKAIALDPQNAGYYSSALKTVSH